VNTTRKERVVILVFFMLRFAIAFELSVPDYANNITAVLY
jgi:hypothetical protein